MKTQLSAKSVFTLAGISLSLLCNPANAQLLNVKIGTTANTTATGDGAYQEAPAAVLGSANSWWNEFAFVSSTPSGVSVVDSAGSLWSGVTLSVANTSGVGALSVSGNPPFLMNTMPYQNPGAGRGFNISLTGLLPSTQYEFVGYASNPTYSAGASWTVTVGTLGLGTTSNDGSSADIADGVGFAYSQFFVTTDGSGNLTIFDESQSGTYPILQGFQLQVSPVPEPSAFALAGMGLAGLLAFRRRR